MGIISVLNDPTKYETIPMLNRVQLIFDSLSFSQVGDMDYGITFQLLKYLKHEKEYAPWLAAFHGLDPINNLLKRTPKHAVFQVSIKGISYFIINYKRLGLLPMSYKNKGTLA